MKHVHILSIINTTVVCNSKVTTDIGLFNVLGICTNGNSVGNGNCIIMIFLFLLASSQITKYIKESRCYKFFTDGALEAN
jgi:hypothetical protein